MKLANRVLQVDAVLGPVYGSETKFLAFLLDSSTARATAKCLRFWAPLAPCGLLLDF